MFRSTDNPDHGSAQWRVLVVDDEPTLRLGFVCALSDEDVRAEAAKDGREALERLERDSFDVVLLDLRMPELDGLEVLRRLRARGDRTPVVLCSAHVNPSVAEEAIHHGVVDFLLKPVRPQDLRETVRFVLSPESGTLADALAPARSGDFQTSLNRLRRRPVRPDSTGMLWISLLENLVHRQSESSLFGDRDGERVLELLSQRG